MIDPVRRFERAVLRPLWLVVLVVAVISVAQGHWWWATACVPALLYAGAIGARLHPRQSALELAGGPTRGAAAQRESAQLSPNEKRLLIGQASTRVAILLAICSFAVATGALDFHWYWSAAIGWVTLFIVGAGLKLAFRVV